MIARRIVCLMARTYRFVTRVVAPRALFQASRLCDDVVLIHLIILHALIVVVAPRRASQLTTVMIPARWRLFSCA